MGAPTSIPPLAGDLVRFKERTHSLSRRSAKSKETTPATEGENGARGPRSKVLTAVKPFEDKGEAQQSP